MERPEFDRSPSGLTLSIAFDEDIKVEPQSSATSAKDRNMMWTRSISNRDDSKIINLDALMQSMEEIKSVRSEYLYPKLNNNIINDTPIQEHFEENKPRKKMSKWKKIAIVTRTINRMRSPIVERIKSEANLRKSITSWSPVRQNLHRTCSIITANQLQSHVLREFRDQSTFFQALERSSASDIAFIQTALESDPRENLYDEDSTQRITNKPNTQGYTPLYVASKNGNIQLLKILLDHRANPYQHCYTSKNDKQTILSVASRWGHLNIVQFLLSNKFMWPSKDLKKAYEQAANKEVKALIKTELDKDKKSFFKRLLSSPRKSEKHL